MIGTVIAHGERKRSDPVEEFFLPFPTVLIGIGMAAWDSVKRDVCRACGNTRLRPHEYCLVCDAWGGDRKRLPAAKPATLRIYQQKTVPCQYGLYRRVS